MMRISVAKFLIFFAVNLLTCVVSQSFTTAEELFKKREQAGPKYVIEVTDPIFYDNTIFSEEDNHRGYHVFVLFSMRQGCPQCPEFEKSFEAIAKSFTLGAPTAPVFFLYVDVRKASFISAKHAISRIPFLFHVHPLAYSKTFQKQTEDTKGVTRHLFHDKKQYPQGPDLPSMLSWMNAAAAQNVALYKSTLEKMVSLAMTLSLLLVLMVVIYFLLVVLVQKVPNLMPFGAMGLLVLGQSGIMYNVIQGRLAWFGVARDGSTEYVMQNFRGQYLGEGLLQAFSMVVSGMMLVLATRHQSFPPGATESEKRARLLVRGQQTILWLMISLWCMYFVMNNYKTKMGWPIFVNFFPPSNFKRGPVGIDQGISF